MVSGHKKDGSAWLKEDSHYICRNAFTNALHVNYHGNPGVLPDNPPMKRACCESFEITTRELLRAIQ